MNTKTTYSIIAILALIIGLLGGAWGYSVSQETTTSDCPSDQEIKKDFVKQLRSKGLIPPEPNSITEVEGEITKLKKNSIVIETEPRLDDPLQELLKRTLTFEINDMTQFTKLPPEGEPPQDTNAPSQNEKDIEFSDLSMGQQVIVHPTEDIKGKTKAEAEIIKLRSSE